MDIDLQEFREQKLHKRAINSLLKRTIKTENNCWEWTGSLWSNGYGRLRYDNKHQRAHRVSYLLHKGLIPDGLLVCHTCDNPKCINPKHLFLGTNKDNMDDADKKGRYHQKFIPGGIPASTKLTKDDVGIIRQLINKELQAIADTYQVSITTIKQINAGKTFKGI